jgi:hypothetical protein
MAIIELTLEETLELLKTPPRDPMWHRLYLTLRDQHAAATNLPPSAPPFVPPVPTPSQAQSMGLPYPVPPSVPPTEE